MKKKNRTSCELSHTGEEISQSWDWEKNDVICLSSLGLLSETICRPCANESRLQITEILLLLLIQ